RTPRPVGHCASRSADRASRPSRPRRGTRIHAANAAIRPTCATGRSSRHRARVARSCIHSMHGSDNYSGEVSRSLIVQTREIDPVEDLLAYAHPSTPLAWLRRGDGIVAVGDAMPAFIRVPAGRASMRSAMMADAWRELAAAAEVDDPLGL